MATQLFHKPSLSSKVARQIWEEAGLPETADEYTIRNALDLWTVEHAHVYEKSDMRFYIQWVSTEGYIIQCDYITFQNWILCAAPVTVVPAAATPALQTEKEPISTITIDETLLESNI